VNPRVSTVIRKELREFRRNKFVVGTMVVLPVIFLVIPVSNALTLKASAGHVAIRSVVEGGTLLLFLVPLILPTTLAAYAVVGEREQATLEPVLTTPVTREEYLLGKALAVVLPTTLIAWTLFALFVVLIRARAIPEVVHLVFTPGVVAAELVFAPLLATFSIWIGLAFSVRSSDVRAAQQLAALAMLPMIAISALFTFRLVHPTLTLLATALALLIVLDVVGWRVVSAMFDRERLLTGFGRGADRAR
jgi:ABC-type Na+ efflux pump permease subunit